MMNLLRPLDRLAGWWLDRRGRSHMAAWKIEAEVDFRLERLNVELLPDSKMVTEVLASFRDVGDFASSCATILGAYNAENFVTWTMQPRADHGTRPMEITIRYLSGKPVGIVLEELRKDRETLLDAIGPLVGVYDACPRPMKEQVPSPIASRYGILRRTYFKVAYQRAVKEQGERADPDARCHADRDGDCDWQGCPQLRDGEPAKGGRHCPLDRSDPEE